MKRQRRTKRAYAQLFDDPASMFPGCEVILFPNGEREILLRDAKRGHAMRLKVSVGPYGFGLTVSRTTLGTALSACGNREGDYEPIRLEDDAVELSITQYNGDERSQAFKAWYRASKEEREAQGIEHPDMAQEARAGVQS